jgi:hypothetical protein
MPTHSPSQPIEAEDRADYARSSRVRTHASKLDKQPASESRLDFEAVFAAELRVLAERRKKVGLDAHVLDEATRADNGVPKPGAALGLIGLSLSGGGIRSASFSLGVLQAFEHAKLNRHFDYLSTVSGGGFVGSTLSSALHHAQSDGTPFAFSISPTSDAAIVKHLRNQSSYLTPGGFLDTVRLPALVIRGLLLNLLALLPWLLGAALLTELYYALAYNNTDTFRYVVDYVPMLVGGGPFVFLLLASPLVPWLERRDARWRERYEHAFAGSLVLSVLGVLSHFVLLVVNYAIEHPDEAKRLLTSFATGWLGLSGALLVAYLVFRGKNTKGARFLRRLVLAAAGMLVPFALFSAYVFLSIHLTPVPYYQDTPNGVSVELVETLRATTEAPAELPTGVVRWLSQQGLEPEDGTFKNAIGPSPLDPANSSGSAGGGLQCIEQVQGCTSLDRCDSCDVADRACNDRTAQCAAATQCRTAASCKTPEECSACEAEQRACEKARASCEDARQCCWSVTDARSGKPFKLSLWAHEETSLREQRGDVSLAIYQISLSSLGLPKLALQFEPFQKLAARLGSESAPRSDHPVGSSAVVRPERGLDLECRIVLTALALSLIAGIVGLLSDANGLSLHGFYRDRLARAFVVRSRSDSPLRFDSAARLRLSELAPDKSGAPYPILNATLNVSGGVESAERFRRGRSFIFSPRFVGSPRTGYVSTPVMEGADPGLSLASATAISAAAAGPSMGSFTSGWLAPLFALLNLRLGYWLPHPRLAASKPRLMRKPGNRHILREGLGLIDDGGAFINVSDGGHFENLGAYELIRRKCRLIVVVDGEEDRLGQLAGLTTLMRLARIDFGAMITSDLSFFRDQREGGSEQPWFWATIRYGVLPDGREEVGYLLYIKASMVPGAPQYVQAYRAQCPDFPHESTADQFFNEVQFECYRALGCYIGGLVTQNRELLEQVTDLLESAPVPSRTIPD